MRLYCEQGRFCVDCDEFKEWSEFGKHKIGTMGHRPQCRDCTAIRRGSKSRQVPPLEIMERYNRKRLRKNEREIRKVFKSIYVPCVSDSMKCITCKEVKGIECFDKINEPRKYNNGRRKNCMDCCEGREFDEDGEMRRDRSDEKYKRKESKEQKIKEAIHLAGGKEDVNNGFVYLYRCDELDCFKIGITKEDPREYIHEKAKDYGLKLELVAFIISPIRYYDAEWLATKDYKGKVVDHTKPCGGKARELFKCGFIDALRRLKGINKEMYLVDNPFINLEDIDATGLDINTVDEASKQRESIRRNDIIARKILRGQAKNKQWCIKNDKGVNKSSCCCAQVLNKIYIDECKE